MEPVEGNSTPVEHLLPCDYDDDNYYNDYYDDQAYNSSEDEEEDEPEGGDDDNDGGRCKGRGNNAETHQVLTSSTVASNPPPRHHNSISSSGGGGGSGIERSSSPVAQPADEIIGVQLHEASKLELHPVDDRHRHGYRMTWVLAIGVDKYLKVCGLPNLRGAERDATAVSDFFRERGGAIMKTLLGPDATPEQVVKAVQGWHRLVGSKDLVIIYFSGHGQREIVDPTDPTGPRTEGVLCLRGYDGLGRGSMRGTMLWEHMRPLRAVHKLMIFDCCYPGHGLAQGIETASSNSWTELIREGSAQVLAAAASDEQSFEGLERDRRRAGIFTRHLLEGLRGAAFDQGTDWMGLDQLCRWLRPRVLEDTQGRQTVRSVRPNNRLLDRAQVIFVRPGATLPAAAAAAAAIEADGAATDRPQQQNPPTNPMSEEAVLRSIGDFLNAIGRATPPAAAATAAADEADGAATDRPQQEPPTVPITEDVGLTKACEAFDLIGSIVRLFEPPLCREPNPDGKDNGCGSGVGYSAGCWCTRGGHNHPDDHRCGKGHTWPNRPQPPPGLTPSTTTAAPAAAAAAAAATTTATATAIVSSRPQHLESGVGNVFGTILSNPVVRSLLGEEQALSSLGAAAGAPTPPVVVGVQETSPSDASYQCTAHYAHGAALKPSVDATCRMLDFAEKGITDYIATKLTEQHRGYFWTVVKGASEVTGRWCMAKFELSKRGTTIVIYAHHIYRDCHRLAADA